MTKVSKHHGNVQLASSRLTKLVADDLDNDQVSSLVEYMTAMSNAQLARHKKTIEINGLTNKKVKFLLHKFLYTRHLPNYGVLDTAGTFEIVHVKPEEKQPDRETLKPTMPFWPSVQCAPSKTV